MRSRGWRGLAAVLIGLCVLATPALAQDDEEKPFFDVPTKPLVKPYAQWGVGVLFVIAILAIAFKNPARTHLD
ncbi:MAG: hypothetical protein CHACPFDD_00780 [Phycisphaerae bacterium]|nr:hypothetical protein [Phycisphaerae bacterium]